MERVAFLLDRTGERINCLLNPESLEVRRYSGLRQRRDAGGLFAGQVRADHPLIATGGGITELDLQLLFDVDIARLERAAPADTDSDSVPGAMGDVRELTRPIWNLTENASADGFGAPPSVRFIWGKSWNIPSVVIFVAERLERFDMNGAPQRSWMSLRLRRVDDPTPRPAPKLPATPQFELPSTFTDPDTDTVTDTSINVAVDDQGTPLTRLDQICAEHYGSAGWAPLLARFNGLDDLLTVPTGTVLSLPPLSALTQQS
jgi:Contractile injection system tube protein